MLCCNHPTSTSSGYWVLDSGRIYYIVDLEVENNYLFKVDHSPLTSEDVEWQNADCISEV